MYIFKHSLKYDSFSGMFNHDVHAHARNLVFGEKKENQFDFFLLEQKKKPFDFLKKKTNANLHSHRHVIRDRTHRSLLHGCRDRSLMEIKSFQIKKRTNSLQCP